MQANGGSDPPTLNDYTFMMQKQAEIITEHLDDAEGIVSIFGDDDCPDE